MPFPNEHAARIKSPGQFIRFRRKNDADGRGVDFIFGIKSDQTSEVQAIRFDSKLFTVSEARKWLTDHDFKSILFEPATGDMGKNDKSFFPGYSDYQLKEAFINLKKEDKAEASLLFRECFCFRDMDFSKEVGPAFSKLAKSILPGILTKSIKTKNVNDILSGKEDTIKVYKKIDLSVPYLLREPNEAFYKGIVRVSELISEEKKVFIYKIRDYISFESNLKLLRKSILVKMDEEKMEMFSTVYKNAESWGELDSDGDFMDSDEIRKAVNFANPRGIGLNIEHDSDDMISRDKAEVIESYQARTGWKEGDLEIRKGDWVCKTKFYDKELWEFTKKNIETYSFEGNGIREESELPEVA